MLQWVASHIVESLLAITGTLLLAILGGVVRAVHWGFKTHTEVAKLNLRLKWVDTIKEGVDTDSSAQWDEINDLKSNVSRLGEQQAANRTEIEFIKEDIKELKREWNG